MPTSVLVRPRRYTGCHESNLNGMNYNSASAPAAMGINWFKFKPYTHSMKTSEMALKAV